MNTVQNVEKLDLNPTYPLKRFRFVKIRKLLSDLIKKPIKDCHLIKVYLRYSLWISHSTYISRSKRNPSSVLIYIMQLSQWWKEEDWNFVWEILSNFLLSSLFLFYFCCFLPLIRKWSLSVVFPIFSYNIKPFKVARSRFRAEYW